METKHTPGPWEVDSGMVQTCDETPIAHMDRTIGNGTMPVERDANARLIAAAPELLEVVTTLLDWFEEAGYNGNGPSGAALLFADDKTLGTHLREVYAKALRNV